MFKNSGLVDDIACDRHGHLFLHDMSGRVFVFAAADGKLITSDPLPLRGFQHTAWGVRVFLDSNDIVYVSDTPAWCADTSQSAYGPRPKECCRLRALSFLHCSPGFRPSAYDGLWHP